MIKLTPTAKPIQLIKQNSKIKISNERFGFSVQKRIWESVGRDYGALSDRIGWRVKGDWILYSDVTFNTSAPGGYFPCRAALGRWEEGFSGVLFSLSRPDLLSVTYKPFTNF